MAGRRRTAAGRMLGVGGLLGVGSMMLGLPGPVAYAGPRGGGVTHGQAAIARSGGATVIQQRSPRAAISWESFDIAPGERVEFRQPSTSAIALNSVRNARPTRIQGALSANGQVWLQNPAGVLFGRGAEVDVGGLLATSARLDHAGFAAGRDSFSGGSGPVVNEGRIRAGEGGVALVAPVVENRGRILAREGDVALAAADGFSVDLEGDGLLGMVVGAEEARSLALVNEGTIRAEGGAVRLTSAQADAVRESVVSLGGIVEATGISEEDGAIVIAGGGTARVSGRIAARRGEAGGEISLNAARIGLAQGAEIDASAPAGGGRVEIGPRSAPMPPKRIVASAGSRVAADATGDGDAGRIDFWSSDVTLVRGEVSAAARGTGDAGLVDISSAGSIGFTGTADLSAADGEAGVLLFDPVNIFVGSGSDDAELDDGQILSGDRPGEDLYITPAALEGTSAYSTIRLEATDVISFDSPVDLPTQSLSLDAGRAVGFYADLTLQQGSLDATAGYLVGIGETGAVDAVNGSVTLTSLGTSGETPGIRVIGILGAGGNATLTGDYVRIYGTATAEGDIIANASDRFALVGGYMSAGNIDISAPDEAEVSSAYMLSDGRISIRATGTIDIGYSSYLSGSGVSLDAGSGDIFLRDYTSLSASGSGDPALFMRAGDFYFGFDSSPEAGVGEVVFAGDGVLGGYGATGSAIDAGEFRELTRIGDLTIVAGGDLEVRRLEPDLGGDFSTGVLTITSEGGAIDVTGPVEGEDSGNQLALRFGEPGPSGRRPSSLTLSGYDGRIGVYAGDGVSLSPPDGLGFYVDGDVRTQTGVTGSSAPDTTIIAADGQTVIDITGAFIQENTTGAPSPLTLGQNAAGAELEALRIDNAARVEIFGTIGGAGEDEAAQQVTFGAGFAPSDVHQVNDCSLARPDCIIPPVLENPFLETDEDMASAPLDIAGLATEAEGQSVSLETIDGVAAEPGAVIPGPEGGVFVVQPDGTVVFDPQDAFQDLAVDASRSFSVPVTVIDEGGAADSALLQVTVLGRNDLPSPMDAEIVTDEDMASEPLDPAALADDIDAMDMFDVVAIDGQPVAPGTRIELADGGAIVVGPDGTLVFDPAGGFDALLPGEEAMLSLPVTVADGGGAQVSATLGITVTGLVEPFALRPGSLETTEDMSADPLAPDAFLAEPGVGPVRFVEIDGMSLEEGAAMPVEGGTISLDASGSLVFDPGPDFEGLDEGVLRRFSVNVTLEDAQGLRRTTALDIGVRGLGEMLALLPGAIETSEDAASDPLSPDALAGEGTGPLAFAEIDGTPVEAGTAMPVEGGTLFVDADGNLVFDPGADFQSLMEGADRSFEIDVTLRDAEGLLDTTPVTITVGGLNDRPDAPMGMLETTEDMASAPLAPGDLATDIDMDGLVVTGIAGQPAAPGDEIALPGGGALRVAEDGTLVFDPLGAFGALGEGETRSFSVDVTVADPFSETATGPLEITVRGLADALEPLNPVLSTDEDMASAPLSPDRIAEDADMEAVSILAIAGMPVEDGASMPMEGGTLFVDAGGNLVFDPGPDFQSLGEGQSAEFPVPVTVGNAAGDTLDVPVTVRVSGINDAPTPPPGNGDGPGAEVDVPEDQPGTLPPDLIGSDPEMGPLSVVAVEGTPVSPGSELVLEGGGVLSVAADGTLVFDPGTDFDFLGDGETNSFELGVTLADDFGARTDTVVTITVVGANDAPRVISAERVTDQDTPAPGLAPSEIAFDPEMDEVFLVSAGGEPLAPGAEISLAGGGVLRVAEDGTLVFDPLGDFRDLAEGETREAAIPLSLADGQGATGEDVLTIRVSGLNDAPVPLMPMISTTEDMVSPGLAARAAAADPDASDALGVVSVNGTALSPGGSVALPGGGALLLAEDGTLLFDPQDGFQSLPANGAATLTVTLGVSDAGGRVVPVPLEIEVAGLNDAPVARDDPGTLADPLRPLTLGVLANDSDIDGDALSVVSVNGRTLSEEGVPGPGGGVFRVAPDGGLIFDPGSDFLSLELGSVAAFDIEYAVADGFGGMASALAGVRVVGDASSGTATNLPARLAGPKTIAESVVTPDPEVRFGTFDALGFLEPDLTEEEPVTNRGDDENWRR